MASRKFSRNKYAIHAIAFDSSTFFQACIFGKHAKQQDRFRF